MAMNRTHHDNYCLHASVIAKLFSCWRRAEQRKEKLKAAALAAKDNATADVKISSFAGPDDANSMEEQGRTKEFSPFASNNLSFNPMPGSQQPK